MIELRWYRMARFKTEHNETIYGEPVLQWREVVDDHADYPVATEWADVPTVLEGEARRK